ncbi:MAG TPA: NAD(P)/FAD-dependent oxidoreductase [Myxococcota bacterium]
MAARARSWDVLIVGAGPAGLSAALVLARCCRSVLVCDAGQPRSWAAEAMHGFLSRDGIHPEEFRRLARADLARYPNVELREARVLGATRNRDGSFRVRLPGRRSERARKLLIATGLVDVLPPIAGCAELYGTGVYHCPYCDAWEHRGRPIAAYGRRQRGFEMARALTAWSRDVTLLCDGPAGLTGEQRRALARNGVRCVETRVARLVARDGRLAAAELADGERIAIEALFFDLPSRPQSTLAERIGCRLTRQGGIRRGQYEASDVPGVFVAGNILRDVQLSIVAAAEGARAAFGIHRSLTREEFGLRETGTRRVEHPRVAEEPAGAPASRAS